MKKETKEAIGGVIGAVGAIGAGGLVTGTALCLIPKNTPKVFKGLMSVGAIGLGGAAGVAADKYLEDVTVASLDLADDLFDMIRGIEENEEPDPLEEVENDMISVKVPKEAYEKFMQRKREREEKNIEITTN